MKRARPSWTEEEKATSTSVKDSDAALAHLEMLYNDTHSADITFIVGNERFNAHRIIVASSSRPFKALLMGHFREGQSKEITISDPFITPEIFKVFLKYIYTRKIEFSVANGFELFHLARIYDFPPLQEGCQEFFKKIISPKNCVSIFYEAKKSQIDEIVHLTKDFFVTNAFEVVRDSNDVFDEEDFVSFLTLDKLNIPEIDLFLYAIKWIELVKPKAKIRNLVISHIRFGCIPGIDLLKKVKPFVPKMVPHEMYLLAFEFQVDRSLDAPPNFGNHREIRKPKIFTSQNTQQTDACVGAGLVVILKVEKPIDLKTFTLSCKADSENRMVGYYRNGFHQQASSPDGWTKIVDKDVSAEFTIEKKLEIGFHSFYFADPNGLGPGRRNRE